MASRRQLGWRGVCCAVALLACALGSSPAARAGGRVIYTFVDENGVTHFTNIPGDPRFKPIVSADEKLGPPPRHGAYDLLIGITAREQQLPPALIKAVIAAESSFDAAAVSHKGAKGLMQLMPDTAASLGVSNPFHPIDNVRGGAAYLREMIDRYGDLTRALAAYNAGPTAVDRYDGVPPYRETRDYVRRVLTYYRQYHGDFAR